MSVYYIKCAMKKGKEVQVEEVRACASATQEGGTFNSTKGKVTISGGVGDGRGWVRGREQGEGV